VKGVKKYLEKLLSNMEELDEDIDVRKVNVQEDHVHIVMVIPPRVSVVSAVKYMKSVSGAKLKEKFEFIKKAMYGRRGIWSRGYCVSTVGLNEKTIMDYVEYQYKEDFIKNKNRTNYQGYLLLLKKPGQKRRALCSYGSII